LKSLSDKKLSWLIVMGETGHLANVSDGFEEANLWLQELVEDGLLSRRRFAEDEHGYEGSEYKLTPTGLQMLTETDPLTLARACVACPNTQAPKFIKRLGKREVLEFLDCTDVDAREAAEARLRELTE